MFIEYWEFSFKRLYCPGTELANALIKLILGSEDVTSGNKLKRK